MYMCVCVCACVRSRARDYVKVMLTKYLQHTYRDRRRNGRVVLTLIFIYPVASLTTAEVPGPILAGLGLSDITPCHLLYQCQQLVS